MNAATTFTEFERRWGELRAEQAALNERALGDGEDCGYPGLIAEDEVAAMVSHHLVMFRERAALWDLLKAQTRRLCELRAENAALARESERREIDVVSLGCDLEQAEEQLAAVGTRDQDPLPATITCAGGGLP